MLRWLAYLVMILAVATAILLPSGTTVRDTRGDIDFQPEAVDARLPLRFAIAVGGIGIGVFLLWLTGRDRPSPSDRPGRRRPA